MKIGFEIVDFLANYATCEIYYEIVKMCCSIFVNLTF